MPPCPVPAPFTPIRAFPRARFSSEPHVRATLRGYGARTRMRLVAVPLLAIVAAGALGGSSIGRTTAPDPAIHRIDHAIVIMQENRSFDSYFGTYPGADGLPPARASPIPRAVHVSGRITTRTTSTAADRTASATRWRTSTAARWTASSRRRNAAGAAAGPYVRAERLVESSRAPVPSVGVVRALHAP